MEGIPVALMEAMAVGIPVVSTLHSGIPELIKSDHSGWLVPENNAWPWPIVSCLQRYRPAGAGARAAQCPTKS
jgi:glycosyltransferase involved in cell wall biosynthesis